MLCDFWKFCKQVFFPPSPSSLPKWCQWLATYMMYLWQDQRLKISCQLKSVGLNIIILYTFPGSLICILLCSHLKILAYLSSLLSTLFESILYMVLYYLNVIVELKYAMNSFYFSASISSGSTNFGKTRYAFSSHIYWPNRSSALPYRW